MPSRPKKAWPFRIEYPPELPISARVDEIVTAIQEHQVVILAGETGSGKTTQLPKMCLAAGRGERGRIACTQPRRVAATSISRRVAEELGVPWGREVGCKIRFADETTRDTVIKFMTDGMLLAELQADPWLREYDTIIVDEAHERSLNIDFILGHLRRLRTARRDLKIVVTSATIDTEAFSRAFDGAPIIEVSGRLYPVEVIWAPLDELEEESATEGEGRARPPGAPSDADRTAGPAVPPYRGKKPVRDDYTYIDAAVEATERVLRESERGDLLVFMPTERDIRETCDQLEGLVGEKFKHWKTRIDLVPLFGRLTNAEQQRVFALSPHRKIVVATNIAETSLTIPGIRFVIDTGLARMSRYAPQSRTRRLPVEPVSQSSADQRKGRCGRVSDGVCIRLYSEQDYANRPRYTQPEIQRGNLADVILRMKASGLGDIEDFPFINAPPAKGIRAGYQLLEELGALEHGGRANRPGEPRLGEDASPYQQWVLTDLGRELAQLPVDPTVGRMILQGAREHALHEVLIIAAGLSIQDPRERPLDQQQKADTAHRRFTHPDSDFLTLLAIWEAYHDEFERMTLGKLRKFCTTHFLSFLRMREWRDIHAQLVEVLGEGGGVPMTSVYDGTRAGRPPDLRFGSPAYRAIHRAILSGLLGNIATRDEDGGWTATNDRKVGVFPGSVLFERPESRKQVPHRSAPPARTKAPRWLMASEIVETGRVYARTCARIDPAWALELGAHLLRVSHTEPFWSADAGRVLVKERRRLYNLELDARAVGYGPIDPVHATEIFIREALVADTITRRFDFLEHNRKLRAKVEAVLTRTRSSGYMNLDEIAYRFYAARLLVEGGDQEAPPPAAGDEAPPAGRPHRGIASVPDLIAQVQTERKLDPRFLFMTEADLQPPAEEAHDAAAFPDGLPLENRVLPLEYVYKPGGEEDGVTLRVGLREAEALADAALDWAVPGHLAAKVELFLKALPKEQRRALIPLADTARQIARELPLFAARAEPPSLAEALAEVLTARLGWRIDASLWAANPLPDHLRVRVEVLDNQGRVLAAGRDLEALRAELHLTKRTASVKAAKDEGGAWRTARAWWEKPPAEEWMFGDLPEQVVVTEQHGVPVLAYPGLCAENDGVAVRLFAKAEEAHAATRGGLAKLLETQLRYEIGWLERDLRSLRALGPLAATLAPIEKLQEHALQSIVRWACDAERAGRAGTPLPAANEGKGEARRGTESAPYRLTAAAFAAALEQAKRDLRGLVPKLTERLQELLTLRLELLNHKEPYRGLAEELAALLPPDFLRRMPFERLPHLVRYLRARQARAERWRRDPAKDSARWAQISPFVAALRRFDEAARGAQPPAPARQAAVERLRWLVEEFRVSLFAQELGTAEPVSAVRLERALAEARGERPAAAPPEPVAGPAPEPPPAPPPAILPAATARKKTVLKSFGALDALKPK
jgi:ATP-dependent helicase HrpA